MPVGDANAGGLAQSLKAALVTFFAVGQNRLELAAIELNEEKCRLLEVLFLGAAFFFLGMVALLLFTVTIVILFWEKAGIALLVGFSVFYLVSAGTALALMISKIKGWPQSFAHTLGEIKKDTECLRTLS
jgi:uncharacterized membrane protein YqjE